MNDDIDPETRELLRAMHREMNGLKPRRGRSPLTYNAASRRPAGEGGAASRAGSRSRGTTPMESRSSGSSDSGSDEDADGSAADASSADDRPRNKRKERSPSVKTAGGHPPKRARRPPSGEPESGGRFLQHAEAAAAHVKAAVAVSAPPVGEPAEDEGPDPSLDTAQPAAAASDRCKCFVAGFRFGSSLPRSVLGSQDALATALALAFGDYVPPIARSALDASRVTLLGRDGRCWGFPQAGSIGSSPAWCEAREAAVRLYVG